jgi:hypothetical protein
MRFKDCKNSHFLALFHEFYCPIKSLANKEKQGILKNQNQGRMSKAIPFVKD